MGRKTVLSYIPRGPASLYMSPKKTRSPMSGESSPFKTYILQEAEVKAQKAFL